MNGTNGTSTAPTPADGKVADILQDEVTFDTGVYCWRNVVNGKVYVGSTSVSFKERKRNHLKGLRKGKSPHQYLQRAWSKYGEGSFEWIVLWRCCSEECIEWEQWWINRLCAADETHGYNMNPTAGSRLGSKASDETKVKVSIAAKKFHSDPDVRRRYLAGMESFRNKPEYRKRLSQAQTKINADPVMRAKRSASLKKTLATPEAIAKKSEAMKRSNADPLVRARKSEGMKKYRANRKAQVEAVLLAQPSDKIVPPTKLRGGTT